MRPSRSKYKIAFITCYFGAVPWYLKFFLKSCGYNPDVDFFIIGDMAFDGVIVPSNVFVIPMSLEQFRVLASEKLALPVNVTHPYKLCDLKPTYGVIFADLVKDHSFWGHGDIDIILGDVRGFITDDVLDRFDVICAREEYVTGFFTLFRNTPNINRLYEHSKDHREVFISEEHYCFDECNFAWIPLMEGLSIFDIRTKTESMTHIVKRLNAEGKIRAYFNHLVIEGLCGEMKWDKGRLYFAGKAEALLYHLIKFKKQDALTLPDWDTIPDRFYIEKDHFLKTKPLRKTAKSEQELTG